MSMFDYRRGVALALALLLSCAVTAQESGTASKGAAPAAVTKSKAKASKPTGKTAAPPFKLILEPRAMDLLKAVSEKLGAAKSMSFTATVGYEYPSKLGPPIVYTSRYEVVMQRPDKLRIVMPGDGPPSEFYYDGKTMTAYAPAQNLAAVADAPPTIDAALIAAYQKAAIYYPFTDLVAADPYKALADGAILAFYIGSSQVAAGTRTDMVAWANDDVFMQAWIGADDKLPRRIRAVFRDDPLHLRHEMELTDWKLNVDVPADTFASSKLQQAGRMAFAAPSAAPPGAKPITLGKGTSKSMKAAPKPQ